MSGQLVPAISLDRYAAHKALEALSEQESPQAERLWKRIQRSWLLRGMNNHVTLALTNEELQLMKQLGASTRPKVVRYRYLAIYRHPEFDQEVRVKTEDRPPKFHTFRIPGCGRKKFRRVKLYKINPQSDKESSKMAKKSKKVDEIDELEGLEELEDELDIEEPEDEDEDEDVEETPKRRKKGKSKTASTKKRRKKAEPVDEEDEDEDEEGEDDEDEEDEPVAKKRSKKGAAKGKSTKSKKSKDKGGPAAGRTTAEMTGGVGTAELAEAASELAEADIDGRMVRIYLRRNEIPKDEDHGRYVWPSAKNKEFQKLAKAIAKEYGED